MANQTAYNQSPGPNAYHLPPLVGYPKHDISKWRNPAYTMGLKTDAQGRHFGPGPAYKVEKMTRYGKAYSPAAPFGKRHDKLGAGVGPGPGAYNPDMRNVGKVKHFGATFGVRPDELAKSQGPGPNAYHIAKNPTIKSTPAFTMGTRSGLAQKLVGPGPNAYNPKLQDKVKTVKFGPPPAAVSAKDTGPGPGAYQSPQYLKYNQKANPPKFAFGVKTSTSPYITPEDNAVYMYENLFNKSKSKDDKHNVFIEWMEFYLRMAVITGSFSTFDFLRISYYISVMAIACVSGWYMFYLKYNDLSLNTDALLHAVLVGHTLYVYSVYLRKRHSLFRIASSMKDRFDDFSCILDLQEYHDLWDKADKLSLTLMKLGSASCLVMYSSYIFNTCLSSERKLLYPLWFPFDLDSNLLYFSTLGLQLSIFSLYSFIHVSGCSFCIGGSHFIGASFQVLGQAFQDMCKTPQLKDEPKPWRQQIYQDVVEEKLKWFLKAHVALISVAKEYKSVYEGIIVEVVVSCEIIICFAGFQIVLALEAEEIPRAGTVLTMALLLMFHLFMFCYPGHHMYTKSEQFRDILYHSQWETQSMSVKRAVHVMLICTLKPVSISFFGIIQASMPSFLNALKTAFSYVNILLILREPRHGMGQNPTVHT